MNNIIEQIHQDVLTAQDFIKNNNLVEYNLTEIKKSEKISKFGFKNKENIINKNAELNEMSKKLIEILPNYQEVFDKLNQKYPFFKAITEEQLEIVCKKYNLFLSDTENFIGNIPNKNVEDMEKFETYFFREDSLQEQYFISKKLKFNIEDFKLWIFNELHNTAYKFEYEEVTWHRGHTNGYMPQPQNTKQTANSIWIFYNSYVERGFQIYNDDELIRDICHHIGSRFVNGLLSEYQRLDIIYNKIYSLYRQVVSEGYYLNTPVVNSMNYKIVAPLSDFHFDDKEYQINAKTHKIERIPPIENNKSITVEVPKLIQKQEIPDPIVLMPIQQSNFTDSPYGTIYLIVTAWGIEAQDELIQNHKLN